MNYEEKYKEALEKARKELNTCGSQDCDAARQIFRLFPELAESECEKVIKEIIELVMQPTWKTEEEFHRRNVLCAWLENIPYTIDHEKREGFHLGYKAGLEKQGEQNPADKIEEAMQEVEEKAKVFSEYHKGENYEQILAEMRGEQKPQRMISAEAKEAMYDKPAEWSEEDERVLASVIADILCADTSTLIGEKETASYKCDWLKSIKDRVGCEANCATTKEWSEEDDKIINGLIESLTRISANTRTDSTSPNYSFYREIEWLQYLKGRVRPKPMYKFGDTELTEEEVCEGLIRGMVNEHNRVTKEVLRTEYEKGRADVLAKIDAIDVDEMVCESGATSRVTQYWYAHGVNDVIKKLKEEQV